MSVLLKLLYNLLVLPAIFAAGVLAYPISGRVRRGWLLRLESRKRIFIAPPATGNWIWLHVASVGEFLMAQPYVVEARRRQPSLRVLCTYSSDSLTRWLSSRPSPFDETILLPWDSLGICQKLLSTYRPKSLLLLRYDLWPNLLFEAQKARVPVLLMAARLRVVGEKVAPLGFFKKLFLRVFFAACDRVLVANSASLAALQREFGSPGRFVLAPQGPVPVIEARKVEEEKLPATFALQPNRIRLIMGSCYLDEVNRFFELFDKLPAEFQRQLHVCFVPHHPSLKLLNEIQKLCADRNLPLQKSSVTANKLQSSGKTVFANLDKWILVDTVGQLFSLYRGADLAWVGNPGTGVHNVLEPLAWSVPVFFNAPYSNSPDALELKNRNAATVSESGSAPDLLTQALQQCHPRSPDLDQQLQRALGYYQECCAQQAIAQAEVDQFLSLHLKDLR